MIKLPFAYAGLYLHICTTIPKMILVTGATGFLGAEVARQLAENGQPLRCTKRKTSIIPALLSSYKNIEWVDADMLDIFALEDALQGVTQVYHAAALVSLKQADKEPMIRTNIAGTGNLVNLCTDHGIRMVHVSSIAAIGNTKPGQLITENHHLDVATERDGYAISKLESEMEVWRGIAEGLNAVIVNPSLIIGPNAGTLGSGQLFETVRRGLKFYTDGGAGFVDVQDVAKCMIALMNSGISEQRYIISAENWSYKDITTATAKAFNIPPPSKLARPWMMKLAWRGAALASFITRKPPAIDKIAALSSIQTRNFDNSKIKAAIGIEFKPIVKSIQEICERLSK
ncbi:NAD-dependent epimerase/dehydratase family protein [Mucilaginibacter antarcticus]|uniref:NAD-dependent epimerase/dehydratase family protein n=1 Tax=Mucilaginibacter antarcticus TaxID=1855725 RepID=A0ABW5XQY0_9SPHI